MKYKDKPKLQISAFLFCDLLEEMRIFEKVNQTYYHKWWAVFHGDLIYYGIESVNNHQLNKSENLAILRFRKLFFMGT